MPEDALGCARARIRPTRCTVIVFYCRRVVLARPARMSSARPTSRAASPATSASEAGRRAACRKWIHRCRVLMNQISTTITAINALPAGRHWFTLHSDFSAGLSVSRLFKGLSSNSHKFSLIVRVRLEGTGNPVTGVPRGRGGREGLVGDFLFSLVAPCYSPLQRLLGFFMAVLCGGVLMASLLWQISFRRVVFTVVKKMCDYERKKGGVDGSDNQMKERRNLKRNDYCNQLNRYFTTTVVTY